MKRAARSSSSSPQVTCRIHRGFQRTHGASTGRQHPLSGGVSDHLAGRKPGRPTGHFGWCLTPRDCCWRPLRPWRRQAGGRERRPRTTGGNLHDDLQLSHGPAARQSCSSTKGNSATQTNPGGTPRGRVLFPPPVPPWERIDDAANLKYDRAVYSAIFSREGRGDAVHCPFKPKRSHSDRAAVAARLSISDHPSRPAKRTSARPGCTNTRWPG